MSFTTIGVPVTGGTLNVGTREGRQGAPVVVLVHGITANHMSWVMVADELGDEVTILAPDLRGRAGSGEVPGPFGMRQHAKDLVSILDHVGIDSATVVGHSMGGFVAAAFANDHADRLDGLVLVDGGVTIASLPEGADIDEVLTAILGPTMERLSMTFASVDEWLAFWKRHPSLQDWNDAIEGYVMADLRGEAPALRSSCAIDAIRADGADTLGEGGLSVSQPEAADAVVAGAPRASERGAAVFRRGGRGHGCRGASAPRPTRRGREPFHHRAERRGRKGRRRRHPQPASEVRCGSVRFLTASRRVCGC